MNRMQSFFRNTSKVFSAEYERTKSISHSGSKGHNRERFLQDFLEECFPKKYVIGGGEVLGYNGEVSSQADIIIYDEAIPVLDYLGTKQFLQAGVLAHIEVKSYLNSAKLKEALDVTKSIKKLNSNTNGTRTCGQNRDTIFSCVFAYKGLQPSNIRDTLSEYYKGADSGGFVDIICVLDKYMFRTSPNNTNENEMEFNLWGTGEDSLMAFFIYLCNALPGTHDLNKYLRLLKFKMLNPSQSD